MVKLQPFVVVLIEHLGIQLSFSQDVEGKCCMEGQASQILSPYQVRSINVSGVRTLDGGDDEFSARSQKCDPLFLMGIVFGGVNVHFHI